MTPRPFEPPAFAVAAGRLTDFIRDHLHECPAEDWMTLYNHTPSYGSTRICVKCGQVWPCEELLNLARRWPEDSNFRPEWGDHQGDRGNGTPT